MLVNLRNNYLRVICAHRYNYLFSRGSFNSHVEFQFIFQPFVVSDIVDSNNLVRGQFGKSIFNFDNFFNIIFRSLCAYEQLFELEA